MCNCHGICSNPFLFYAEDGMKSHKPIPWRVNSFMIHNIIDYDAQQDTLIE